MVKNSELCIRCRGPSTVPLPGCCLLLSLVPGRFSHWYTKGFKDTKDACSSFGGCNSPNFGILRRLSGRGFEEVDSQQAKCVSTLLAHRQHLLTNNHAGHL